MPEIFIHPKKKKPWIKFDQRAQGNDRGNSTSAICDHQRPATPEEVAKYSPRPKADK
ncbi:MAG: hypothetical protein ACR2P3_07090 [Geminicoccaceae bacterium]